MGKRGKSHIVFSWVNVDSLRVAVLMMSARTSVLVAHLIVKRVHLLNPIFSHWVLIVIVKSPAI
jgi:hypothetical protein